jgi:hypothetical protein
MRQAILTLGFVAMAALFHQKVHAQYFELNAAASSSSSIVKLFELDGYVYAQIGTYGGSVISKYDTNGQLVATNVQNYSGGPVGRVKVYNDKIFIQALYDYCDYYNADFFIHRIDQNLILERDFESTSIWDWNSPLQEEWMNYDGVTFAPLNDSVVVVMSHQKLLVIDIDNSESLLEMSHSCGGIEMDRLETSSDACVVYGNSGIYIFENDTLIQVSEQPTTMLKQRDGFFYTSGDGGIKKLDSDFSVLATYPIYAWDMCFYNGNVHVSNNETMYVFDEDLNLLSTGHFYNNGNFNMRVFTISNDQYFIGGFNRVTEAFSNATFVLRNYSLDFETEEFHQDIGISNVELTGYQFLPGSVFNGNVMNYNLKLSLVVTLDNYSPNPVSSSKILWKNYPYNPMGACISTTYLLNAVEIPPNGSAEFHINDLFYRNQSSPGNGNTSTFELCLTSHAPDAKVDDDRSNDVFCETFTVLFIGMDEVQLSPFNWFYNATMDHIEIMDVEDCQVSLYSSAGQLLHAQNLMHGTHQVSMSSFASGLYLLRMDTGTSSHVVKVMKQ